MPNEYETSIGPAFQRMSSSARDSKLYDYERAKERLIAKWGPEIELRLLAR